MSKLKYKKKLIFNLFISLSKIDLQIKKVKKNYFYITILILILII